MIKLIVGLGNIGSKYLNTRHNIGSKYIRLLAKRYNVVLYKNEILSGYVGSIKLFNDNVIQLLIPDAYINNSGISVAKCIDFFELHPNEILVAHDDLDLLPGKIRIKLGSKNFNGHRGVKDIIVKLNNEVNFYRLKIGIGRPNVRNEIIDFVLSPPYAYEINLINNMIYKLIQCTEDIVINNFIKVMNRLCID